jgi:hypothetical protein
MGNGWRGSAVRILKEKINRRDGWRVGERKDGLRGKRGLEERGVRGVRGERDIPEYPFLFNS